MFGKLFAYIQTSRAFSGKLFPAGSGKENPARADMHTKNTGNNGRWRNYDEYP